MGDNKKRVRVTGSIQTNRVGSECKFDFSMMVPAHLTGEELEAYVEEEAKDSAFDLIEWNYKVEDAL